MGPHVLSFMEFLDSVSDSSEWKQDNLAYKRRNLNISWGWDGKSCPPMPYVRIRIFRINEWTRF